MKYIRRTSKDITNNFLKELLVDRKVISEEDINFGKDKPFFNPTWKNLLSPKDLDNIEEGYQLLKKHINNNSTIYLCIDPDVDGYTSAALFYNYMMNEVTGNFTIKYHIPDEKEHGLSTIMNLFVDGEKSCDLIVLPDSASNDYEQHKILRDMGYDILILDHHEAEKYSEDAIIINNQLSKNYSNKNLSGVGVVFKFFEYWEQREREELIAKDPEAIEGWDTNLFNYLDLVALGQISDMMFMETLENRFICEYGLDYINNGFISELVKKQAFSLFGIPVEKFNESYFKELTQIGVAFYIAPLINALIRVGNEIEKTRLFQAFITPQMEVPSTKRGEKGLVETIATQSARNCTNAKARQNKEKEKAIDLLNIQIINNCLDENKILILNADDLNVSNTLTGLCAMGVAAEHKKPVMLGRISPDGYLKGSIRGREESELKDFKAFLNSSGLMDYVEGHPNAAGFSIKVSDIDKLTEFANKELANINFNEGFYEADFIVKGNCSYLSDMIEDLDRGRRLYGQGNDEPIVVVEDITINCNSIEIIGKNNDTVRFNFNGVTYIKFKAKDLINEIQKYSGKINIVAAGHASVNHWGGMSKPQILLDEIEIKECSDLDF